MGECGIQPPRIGIVDEDNLWPIIGPLFDKILPLPPFSHVMAAANMAPPRPGAPNTHTDAFSPLGGTPSLYHVPGLGPGQSSAIPGWDTSEEVATWIDPVMLDLASIEQLLVSPPQHAPPPAINNTSVTSGAYQGLGSLSTAGMSASGPTIGVPDSGSSSSSSLASPTSLSSSYPSSASAVAAAAAEAVKNVRHTMNICDPALRRPTNWSRLPYVLVMLVACENPDLYKDVKSKVKRLVETMMKLMERDAKQGLTAPGKLQRSNNLIKRARSWGIERGITC